VTSAASARHRAFVRRTTKLRPIAQIEGLRLHVADDPMTLLGLTAHELGLDDAPLPFWAFPWAGGLGLSRYLLEHPEEVAGRRVLDLAAGSGLCGFVALIHGAASVVAVDIDPLARAAIQLNASANSLNVEISGADLLDGPPPDCEVILAGDVCYEETMALRMIAWLQRAADAGIHVLIGDPGRAYLPPGLRELAVYEVRTSRELERSELTRTRVLTVPAG
jgi:predicted nicotinamide N-methyase